MRPGLRLGPVLRPDLRPALRPVLRPALRPDLRPDLRPVLRPVLRPELRGVLLITLFLASVATAQPRRPFVADPSPPHLVEGRVLDPRGRPMADVVVERVTGPTDARPFSAGTCRTSTDALGRFSFEFRGLGPSTGRTWYLAIRRPGCAPEIRVVRLRRGELDGADADVARDVRLQVGTCAPVE